MKSYFSRFLHHTLSYSGLTRISRWNKIAIAAKENAADLYSISMQKEFNDTNKDVEYQGKLYGDAYCTSQQNCLRYLDLNKIDNMCNNCNEKGCQVYVIWKQT